MLAHRKALTSGDPALVQLSFAAAVIDDYRGRDGFQVIRTDTVGRIKKQGGWTVDLGIAPDEQTVHASWSTLVHALPEGEREHWASHTAEPSGYSATFLRMQLSPNSCNDDGDVRSWT